MLGNLIPLARWWNRCACIVRKPPLLSHLAMRFGGQQQVLLQSIAEQQVEPVKGRDNGVTSFKYLGYVDNYNNRNPRNLELLALQAKARGYKTTRHREDFYHKAHMQITNRHIDAYVCHKNGRKIVTASTKEFPIARHLYKTSDVTAAFNVGRILAERCLAAGVQRLIVDKVLRKKRNKKTVAFITAFRRNGINLSEPRQNYKLMP